MIIRRLLIATLIVLIAAPSLALAASSPAAPVIKIYQRVVASYDGKDNTDNGFFIMKNDRTRRQYFSARTVKLWREADADTPKGDVDALGFDPVTNSQDPLVRAFDTSIEKHDAKSATVLVRISGKPGPITQPAPRDLIRYDMVLERGRWKIDDIRGTVDTEWSVRKIMSDYVAMCARPENIKACH
ncbi:MAG: DUF3828 domain-containing protein [Pseudolabrys sp.]